ncbi:MAG: EamA family transporter [Bacillota bacterium]
MASFSGGKTVSFILFLTGKILIRKNFLLCWHNHASIDYVSNRIHKRERGLLSSNTMFPNKLSLAAYITVCLVWGSTYLAIRIGVAHLPPALFAGIRFLLAGAILLLILLWRGVSLPQNSSDFKHAFIVGAFLLFGGNGCIAWAEQFVVSSLTALIIAALPLFVALLDTFWPGGNRMSTLGWLGMLVGFSGVAILVAPGIFNQHMDVRGIGGVLLGTIFWAAGSVYSNRYPPGCSIWMGAAIQNLSGGLLLTTVGLLAGEYNRFHLNSQGILAITYLVLFGSLAAYSAFIYILHTMPPAKASTYAYINPVVAVVLGYLILQEPVSWRMLLAAAVILAGVLMVQLSRTSPQTPSKALQPVKSVKV